MNQNTSTTQHEWLKDLKKQNDSLREQLKTERQKSKDYEEALGNLQHSCVCHVLITTSRPCNCHLAEVDEALNRHKEKK